ncbi:MULTISPECIES: YceI family protein [Clavibacter]|uniref:Polyisoprenoid-binding protein n=1 Tax=Clavibacter tessellarius TaxID=31965 RepID=A0A154V3Y6_9MICO|nr:MULTISPECIES: YceI family protein [Clavibacter]KZC95959.1 polyisoprenoid-binding protein [Clavibacter michiganensis subsp. tessellarius]MDA3804520.1 YceI family protein [Clavibacter sp. CT19]
MEKKTKIIIGVAGGAIVVVGAFAAFGGPLYAQLAGTPDAPPSLSANAASGQALTNLSGDWSVGGDSYAGYRVNEVLNGTPVTVNGRTKGVTGDITVTGQQVTAGTIQVDVTTMATDAAPRDAYFQGEAMKTSEFPTATFTLTQPITTDGVEAGVPATYDVTGDLTLHGVTKPVTAKMQAAFTEGSGQITGSIPITFQDFGVQAPSLGFVTVEDHGSVEFSLDVAPKA